MRALTSALAKGSNRACGTCSPVGARWPSASASSLSSMTCRPLPRALPEADLARARAAVEACVAEKIGSYLMSAGRA